MNKAREELLRTLIERMGAVWRGMHAVQGFRFAGLSVRFPHVRILFYLVARPEGVPVKDLAEILGVTSGAITQFIDALVEKGLVHREEDPDDRRLMLMRLTDFAVNNMRQFRQDYLESVSSVFETLTDAEIIKLTGLLRKANLTSDSKENIK